MDLTVTFKVSSCSRSSHYKPIYYFFDSCQTFDIPANVHNWGVTKEQTDQWRSDGLGSPAE